MIDAQEVLVDWQYSGPRPRTDTGRPCQEGRHETRVGRALRARKPWWILWVAYGCGLGWVRGIRHSQEEDSSLACLVWASPHVQSSFAPLPNLCQTLLILFHSFSLVLRLLQDWNRSWGRGCKLLQPLWKTMCHSPVELNICILYDLPFYSLVCSAEISLDVFTRRHVKDYLEPPKLETIEISIIWE